MKKKELNIVYYDIETDDKVKIKGKGYNAKCTRKGTISSVVFKEQGKEPVAFTIGVNWSISKTCVI